MKLKEKKKNPNTLYWRKKADDVWADIITSEGKCVICSRTTSLNAHHIITRGRLRFRHDIDNGLCMCSHCHRFNANISPHVDSFSAENFLDWLMKKRPDQFLWYQAHKADKRGRERTYKEDFEELSKVFIL